MNSPQDSEWLDARLKERAEIAKQKQLSARDPSLPAIDASKFADPLSKLAETITYKVEREGPHTMGHSPIPVDTGVILRQIAWTFKLLRFVNADDTRFNNSGYRHAYSFVILPLIRTMIDGFYNCTAMLDDPSRSRVFRISGYYRMREALRADETKYSQNPSYKEFLAKTRTNLDKGMQIENISDHDLDNKANKWPLLGDYLRSQPRTPHKELLRKLTLGFWKEYSSISHASFDGLVSLYPFIAGDRIPHDERDGLVEAADRHISTHIGRAASILLCLLTEIQHFYKFDSADIDDRLGKIWSALIPMVEVRELYDARYKGLLKNPAVESKPTITTA